MFASWRSVDLTPDALNAGSPAPPLGDAGLFEFLVAVLWCEPAEHTVFAQPLVHSRHGEYAGNDGGQRGRLISVPLRPMKTHPGR